MTQTVRILKHLKSGKKLTPRQASDKFLCDRLAARICDLRREGYDIATEIVKRNGKHFARYFMGAA